jgi:DNA polymerase III alpha subunit
MIPRHTYDKNYVPIPDAQPGSEGSMINFDVLPPEVQEALRVARDHERNGAVYPSLVTDEVRAYFHYQDRKSQALLEVAAERELPVVATNDAHWPTWSASRWIIG